MQLISAAFNTDLFLSKCRSLTVDQMGLIGGLSIISLLYPISYHRLNGQSYELITPKLRCDKLLRDYCKLMHNPFHLFYSYSMRHSVFMEIYCEISFLMHRITGGPCYIAIKLFPLYVTM